MAQPPEVTLPEGWLQKDIERAQSRLREWGVNMPKPDPQTTVPKADETWRARSGRVRHVIFVQNEDDLQDDGRWCLIHYMRPSPAQEGFAVVTLKQWRAWVEKEQAFRTTKTWRAA
jgi:hypothetical protein